MKRLISTFTLIILILASCDSPVSNVVQKSQQQQVKLNTFAPKISYSTKLILPDTTRKSIWQHFKARNKGQWRVRWNKHTGLPASIFSGLTKKYPGTAKQAARTFLAEYASLFGFSNMNQLKYIRTKTHRGISHVTFNQMVNDVPVYDAQYKVHLRPDGRVDMANGTYYPNVKVSTNPSISQSKAIKTAQSNLNAQRETDKEMNQRSELVIYRSGEQFYLAQKIILFSKKKEPLADWLYFVDAHSGEILDKFNRLTDVTGDGDIYPTHPELSSVVNTPFYRLAGNNRPYGMYAYSVNDASSDAYSTSQSFVYSPSNTHFDEANLYYHIDNFRQNFIEGIDDGSLGLNQITAHAHTPIQDINGDGFLDPNAYFSPSSGELYFNDEYAPLGTQDFAKEDKVIHHEYTHAIIFDIQSGINGINNDEEAAISEGTPDYFAGSFTNRSIILDYAVPSAERDMDNPDYTDYSQLPRDQNGNVNAEPHAVGEFFSAILWDMRDVISTTIIDNLVYDALYRVSGDPDFLGFRNAMLAADDATYSGNHKALIQDTFADRGVGNYAPLGVSINGPFRIDVGETGTWTSTVTNGSGPYTYRWYRKPARASTYWQQVSTNSSYSGSGLGDQDFNLKLEVTDNNSKTGNNIRYIAVGQFDQPSPEDCMDPNGTPIICPGEY